MAPFRSLIPQGKRDARAMHVYIYDLYIISVMYM